MKPRARVQRRTLLLAALGAGAAAVPFVMLEARANGPDPREAVFSIPDGHADSVAFSPDGRTLATGLSGVQGIRSTLRLWDVADGTATTPWPDQIEGLTKVAYSPDGKTLAMTGASSVSLWNLADRTGIALLHPQPTLDLAFAPDGKTLATGCGDGAARLWDLSTGTITGTLTTSGMGAVHTVAFGPDRLTLTTASTDATEDRVRLWDLYKRTIDATLDTPHRPGFIPVAVSRVNMMATGGGDNLVRVWDSATGPALSALSGHTGPVTTVAFSPDGDTLATGSQDKTVRLWDTSTLDVLPLDTLTGHTDKVTSVAFSPDGTTLASAGLDGTIRLWPSR